MGPRVGRPRTTTLMYIDRTQENLSHMTPAVDGLVCLWHINIEYSLYLLTYLTRHGTFNYRQRFYVVPAARYENVNKFS